MSANTQTRWFSEMLREEGLEDLRPFLEAGFFDEIPFYSRYDQLPAPGATGRFEADSLLIRSCLDYLDGLLERADLIAPLLAAITVVKEGRDDPIIPSLFACCGDERVQTVLSALRLGPPGSSLGRYVGRVLDAIDPGDVYGLLQDSVTVPGRPRMFLVRRHPPSPGTIGLDRFGEGQPARVDGGRRARKSVPK